MLRCLLMLALVALAAAPGYPLGAALAQGAVSVSVDRGGGAPYAVGETVVIRYQVPQPTHIRILSTAVNGTSVLAEADVEGPGEVPVPVTLPLGQRTVTLQTYSGTQLGATAQTGFTVITRAPGTPRPLACGGDAGQLNTAADVDAWTFSGANGQDVAVRVDAFPAVPVRLLSPDGTMLATGLNGFSTASLAVNGTYVLQVGGGSAPATGPQPAVPYTIALDCGGVLTPETGSPAVSTGAVLDCGGSAAGQLADITDAQGWLVNVPAGQRVSIAATGPVAMPIRVYDLSGALVTAASNQVRSFNFPAAGQYTVVVGNGTIANAPSPLPYTVSVGCAPRPAAPPTTNLPCYGSSVTSTLASRNDTDQWVFAGVYGRTITVTVDAPVPLPVSITDSNGQVIGSGISGVRGAIVVQTGQHTITVGGGRDPDPGDPVLYTIGLNCGGS